MHSEVGRTPNSVTPEDETGQIPTRSGPSEKRGFGQTLAGLNILYSLEAGQWLASRQVAQAHGHLVAYIGNENRIGLKADRGKQMRDHGQEDERSAIDNDRAP